MAYKKILTLLVLAVAVALRLASVPDRSMWLDELITRDVARLPLYKPGFLHAPKLANHSILSFALHDTGPGPLTYLVDGLFAKLAEPLQGEFWLRLPGIFAGILTVLLLLIGGRQLFGSTAGAVGVAAVAAVFPNLVEWSTGARGYGWVVLIAFLQYHCAATACTRSAKSGDPILLLVAFSIFGVLFHPVHMLWTASVLMGLAIVCWKTGQSWKLTLTIATGLITAIVCGLWIVLWYQLACSKSAAPANTGTRLLDSLGRSALQEWPLILLGIYVTAGSLLLVPRQKQARQFFSSTCVLLTVVFSVLLAAVLVSRFFLATRYFYALTCAAVIVTGRLAHFGYVVVRSKRGLLSARRFVTYLTCTLIVIFCVPAWQTAQTPLQDWKATVLWLKDHAQNGEIVLTGPNSEYEVLLAYSRAAGLEVQLPLYAADLAGKRVSLQTEEGLAAALKLPGTIWFVTAYEGLHRTPQYWQRVRSDFAPVTVIPGKGDVRILVRK